MVVTIHQPEHLPWLGFIDKVRQADTFVILDHVQFRKHYYQNRNRIRGTDGALWLTVPVLTRNYANQAINDVLINNQGSPRWKDKCWGSLVQHYRNAKYWLYHAGFFERLYKAEWLRLADLNETIIRYLLESFSTNVKIIRSSELQVEGGKGELILHICRKLGADVYLSGVSGGDYLDLEKFANAGIEVRFQDFHHPVYKQLYDPFLPGMSSIDLLVNHGPASLDIVKGIGVKTLDAVFL